MSHFCLGFTSFSILVASRFWSVASCSLNLFSLWEAFFSEAVVPTLWPCLASSAVWPQPQHLPQTQLPLARAPGQPSLPAAAQPLSSNCPAPTGSELSGPKYSLTPNPPPRDKCRNSCLMGSSNTEFREEGGKEEACMTPILFRKRGFT